MQLIRENASLAPAPGRWGVLALATLTNTLVSAVPSMCMPVLFEQISIDLHLNLVQIGMIWGISALPGIFTGFVGGAIGDRLGPRRVLVAACLLVGLTGALRGLADGFASLAAAMFLFGVFAPFITMNTLKTCGMWFPRSQLGLASGVLSMGMALGFLSGSMLSAAFLSPWLGGWRQVLFLYGGIAVVLSIPWFFLHSAPVQAGARDNRASSVRMNLAHVVKIRNVWLLGLAMLGIGSCIQGALGYLPMFLRGQGWTETGADGALAAFHTVSMICVIPIALFSDRLGSRLKILIPATIMVAVGIGSLSIAQGVFVWLAVGIAGMVRDGFMAVFITSVVETEGVGPAYTGTAMGMIMVFSGVGNLIAPPLGNSLASISPGLPFVFWASLTILGFVGLLATREKVKRPAAVTA
jgi:MFS family permease